MMNQVKRSGLVTRKRYDALVGLLKGVIAARPSIAVVGTRKMLDTQLVTMAQMRAR